MQTITGWLGPGFPAEVTSVWPSSCSGRITTLNNTDANVISDNDRYEILYCTLAHVWVGDGAMLANDTLGGCDITMPGLYDADRAYNSLTPVERGVVLPCLKGRVVTFNIHNLENATWVPHDMCNNLLGRVGSTAADLFFAFKIYQQVMSDREVPAATLLSAGYRDSWRTAGYSVDHLDVLSEYRNTMTASEVEATVADFDPGMYVQNAIAKAADDAAAGNDMSRVAMFTRRTYDPARIENMIRKFWGPIYGEGRNESLAGSVIRQMGDHMISQSETTTVSVSLAPGIFDRLTAANNTRVLANSVEGFVNVFLIDIPATFVRLSRFSDTQALKRTIHETTVDLPLTILHATKGLLILISDLLSGRAAAAHTWLNNATIQTYLQEHAAGVQPLTTASAHPAAVHTSDLLSSTAAKIWSSINTWLPAGAPAFQISALFQQSVSTSSVVTAATARRLALSRFAARVALAAGAGGRGSKLVFGESLYPSQTKNHSQRYVKATYGLASSTLPCRLAVFNETSCETTYPLCDSCLGLDQTVGYSVGAALALVAHLNATATDEVSFRTSLANYNTLSDYLQNKSAPAILGDSPLLPARYPWRDHDNWRILGDPTPNKLRFHDVEDLATATYNYFVDRLGETSAGATLDSFLTSSTTPLGPIVVNSSRARTGRSFNDVAADTLDAFLPSLMHLRPARLNASTALGRAGLVTLPDRAGLVRFSSSSSSTSSTSTTTLFDLGYAWFHFFFYSAISCDYSSELDGSTKRHSVGEVVFGVLIVSLALALLVSYLLPAPWLVLLGGTGTLFGMLLLLLGWWAIYDWSILCLPAAPLGFGDDALYFVSFTLLTRCMGGGFVDQAEYNNSNCAACSNWQDNVWTVPDFAAPPDSGAKFGFEDLSYNIIFTLRWLWPSALTYLRTTGTTLPIIGGILSSDLVQARIERFGNLDLSQATTVAYSQFILGNIVTGVLNLLVVIGFGTAGLLLLAPLIKKLLSVLGGLVVVGAGLGQTSVFGVSSLYEHVADAVPYGDVDTTAETAEWFDSAKSLEMIPLTSVPGDTGAQRGTVFPGSGRELL